MASPRPCERVQNPRWPCQPPVETLSIRAVTSNLSHVFPVQACRCRAQATTAGARTHMMGLRPSSDQRQAASFPWQGAVRCMRPRTRVTLLAGTSGTRRPPSGRRRPVAKRPWRAPALVRGYRILDGPVNRPWQPSPCGPSPATSRMFSPCRSCTSLLRDNSMAPKAH